MDADAPRRFRGRAHLRTTGYAPADRSARSICVYLRESEDEQNCSSWHLAYKVRDKSESETAPRRQWRSDTAAARSASRATSRSTARMPIDHAESATMALPVGPVQAATRAKNSARAGECGRCAAAGVLRGVLMRIAEQMNIAESAGVVGIQRATVKTRLHSANECLRQHLAPHSRPYWEVHSHSAERAAICRRRPF